MEFGAEIGIDLNNRVMALDAMLRDLGPPVIETVPTYRALLVTYDARRTDFDTIAAQVKDCCASLPGWKPNGRHWVVPVVYGDQVGIDLDYIAKQHGMTAKEVIRRHSSAQYRVYMIGFMPGFTYLGGLDEVLATPRRATPRMAAPPGSVTIGGAQTAITSIEAPCGWHIIGRSPVRAFMPQREPACLFAAGDVVSFEPLAIEEFEALSLAAYTGEPVARRVA